MKKIFRTGIIAIVALVIGVGAVLALNRGGADVAADSVVILKTLGMTCGSCAGKIEKALSSQPGIDGVKIDIDTARVAVAYDAKLTTPEAISAAVTTAGFKSGVVQSLPLEQFQNITGQDISNKNQPNQPKKSGCGGSCC